MRKLVALTMLLSVVLAGAALTGCNKPATDENGNVKAEGAPKGAATLAAPGVAPSKGGGSGNAPAAAPPTAQ
jgi:hypothetical protein